MTAFRALESDSGACLAAVSWGY